MAGVTVADWAFKVSDLVIAAATLLGPILAVQAQKWLERGRDVQGRRVTIFRILMATRATRLSPEHVEAINTVPVDFYGSKPKLKAIIDDWHVYLNLLGNRALSPDALEIELQRAFLDMMHKISIYLGYKFSRSKLEKYIYRPVYHVDRETNDENIRRGLASLLKGEIALSITIKNDIS